MTDRKNPGVAFWATVVLVAVLVVYPLSIGIAWRMCYSVGHPDWLTTALDYLYRPLWFALGYGPRWLLVAFGHYAIWGSGLNG